MADPSRGLVREQKGCREQPLETAMVFLGHLPSGKCALMAIGLPEPGTSPVFTHSPSLDPLSGFKSYSVVILCIPCECHLYSYL